MIFFLALFSCSHQNGPLINGAAAPDFTAPDRNGQPVRLSSFRGSLVLVNFWASWCKPCRDENPKMVALYDKYDTVTFKKAERFSILSVSLDSEKDKWLQAIAKDNLRWQNHVCDLMGWKSAAVDSFRVGSIPATFLIDQNGIIIGKDLKMKDFDRLLGMLAEK